MCTRSPARRNRAALEGIFVERDELAAVDAVVSPIGRAVGGHRARAVIGPELRLVQPLIRATRDRLPPNPGSAYLQTKPTQLFVAQSPSRLHGLPVKLGVQAPVLVHMLNSFLGHWQMPLQQLKLSMHPPF